jgi:hypothetical protein
MRSLFVTALLALLPAAALAEGPTRLDMQVGDERPFAGFRPICDDPSIATITAEGKGVLKALKVGETLCSASAGTALGQRTVYKVVVSARSPKAPGGKGGAAKGADEG